MERVLKRIFYLMDICGNKRMITGGVTHMSVPSGGGRGHGLGGAKGGWDKGGTLILAPGSLV